MFKYAALFFFLFSCSKSTDDNCSSCDALLASNDAAANDASSIDTGVGDADNTCSPAPAGGECSIQNHCGCPSGQTCDLGCMQQGCDRTCRIVGGTEEDARCALNSDSEGWERCRFDQTCFAKMCRRFCGDQQPDVSRCDPGEKCWGPILDTPPGHSNLGGYVCVHACDPNAQTGCPPGTYCSENEPGRPPMCYFPEQF